jgi:ribosome biogenesis protein SSF1/2
VVLFNYDKEKDVVEQRHYAVRASNSAVSRPIKRVIMSSSKQLPDLGHLDDISDWLLEQVGSSGGALFS